MTERYVISEEDTAYPWIEKKYRYQHISLYENQLNLKTLEEMKRHPITKIIVVDRDNKNKIKLIKESISELKDWAPKENTDFTYSHFLNDKTYLIIINSVNHPIEKLLNDIKVI